MEDGWDMVSMVREGFDLEEMVVRTTIREQSLSLASRLGPNLGPILLAPIQIFVVGTCSASGNGSGVMLRAIVEG